MTNPTDQEVIREFADRPRRYRYAGGQIELYWGLWMLGMSLLAGASRLASKSWRPAFVVAIVAWQVLLWIGMRAVRRRVIDRRTGYVQYRRRRPSRRLDYFLFVAAIAGLSFLFNWYGRIFSSTAFIAAGNAALYAWVSRLDRPWKWAILLAMAAGPLILQGSGVDFHKQPLPWIALLGLLWTIGGAVTFCLYLRGSRALGETTR